MSGEKRMATARQSVVPILWFCTVGSLLILAYCAYRAYSVFLPWVSVIPCAAWAAWAAVKCHEKEAEQKMSFGKQILRDVRPLLWLVTVGGIVLAFYCVYKGFTGALPWIGTMVGLPWTAWGTVASFYMKKSEKQCLTGGITFESAKAKNFVKPYSYEAAQKSDDTPTI